MIYGIYKTNKLANCISEGADLFDVVEKAESYLHDQYQEENLYGYHSDYYTLYVLDEDTDKQLIVEITLTCEVEEPIDEHKEYGVRW